MRSPGNLRLRGTRRKVITKAKKEGKKKLQIRQADARKRSRNAVDKVFGRWRRKGQEGQTTQRQSTDPPACQERLRTTMSRVPNETTAQTSTVSFMPPGGDQASFLLQSVQVHLP